jgi:hypothetical protein
MTHAAWTAVESPQHDVAVSMLRNHSRADDPYLLLVVFSNMVSVDLGLHSFSSSAHSSVLCASIALCGVSHAQERRRIFSL